MVYKMSIIRSGPNVTKHWCLSWRICAPTNWIIMYSNNRPISQIPQCTPVPYPTMHHSKQKRSGWGIVRYGTSALRDFWDWSLSVNGSLDPPILLFSTREIWESDSHISLVLNNKILQKLLIRFQPAEVGGRSQTTPRGCCAPDDALHGSCYRPEWFLFAVQDLIKSQGPTHDDVIK